MKSWMKKGYLQILIYEWNDEERKKYINKARERLISKLTSRPRMHELILKL